jgi:hypothetical protein
MRGNKSKAHRSRRQTNHSCIASVTSIAALEPDLETARGCQEQLLNQIEQGAKHCQEIEAQLRTHPAPGLETIIKLYRVLVLKLSAELQARPEKLALINSLIKPVLDWERLEEKRKDRELEQQKYRDQLAAKEAERTKNQAGQDGALQPKTLERIEHELNLF